MDVTKIPTGKAPPGDVNVVIEIPQGSAVKYEVDKESGAVFVDRFSSRPWPIRRPMASFPNTLVGRRRPTDALVLVPGPGRAGLRDPGAADRRAFHGR